jgi:hypothetical protein
MKRIATGLAAGALGIFLLAPCVKAQSWQDMQNDHNAIEEGHEQVNHDRQELRNDLRNGDFVAAECEQKEIDNRQAAVRDRQEDLNNDMANHNYYGGDDEGHAHHWRYHHHDDDHD